MIGLLLKDLIYMRKQGKIMLLLLVFYAVIFFQAKNAVDLIPMISMVIVLISTILVLNSFAYDELSKWDIYSLSLPVTKLESVVCKYLLTLLLAGAGGLLCIAIAAVKQMLNKDAWLGIYAAFGAALLLACILIPLLLKFGVQRSRLFIALVALLPTVGAMLLKHVTLPAVSLATLEILFKLSPVLLAAILMISIFISVKIYERKDL